MTKQSYKEIIFWIASPVFLWARNDGKGDNLKKNFVSLPLNFVFFVVKKTFHATKLHKAGYDGGEKNLVFLVSSCFAEATQDAWWLKSFFTTENAGGTEEGTEFFF